jgi:cysteine synthase
MMRVMATAALPAPLETTLLNLGQVSLKPELWQWTGSLKYRMVYAKLPKALQESSITSETTLVEVASGSTGAAIAWGTTVVVAPHYDMHQNTPRSHAGFAGAPSGAPAQRSTTASVGNFFEDC